METVSVATVEVWSCGLGGSAATPGFPFGSSAGRVSVFPTSQPADQANAQLSATADVSFLRIIECPPRSMSAGPCTVDAGRRNYPAEREGQPLWRGYWEAGLSPLGSATNRP